MQKHIIFQNYDAIKKVAQYTTQKDVEHDAFAEAIYKYIEF